MQRDVARASPERSARGAGDPGALGKDQARSGTFGQQLGQQFSAGQLLRHLLLERRAMPVAMRSLPSSSARQF